MATFLFASFIENSKLFDAFLLYALTGVLAYLV